MRTFFFFFKVMARDLAETRPFVKCEQIKVHGEGLAPVLTGEQLVCDLDVHYLHSMRTAAVIDASSAGSKGASNVDQRA